MSVSFLMRSGQIFKILTGKISDARISCGQMKKCSCLKEVELAGVKYSYCRTVKPAWVGEGSAEAPGEKHTRASFKEFEIT